MPELPKKLVDVATLSRRLTDHDDDNQPEDRLKEIHEDWRIFRKWRREYKKRPPGFGPMIALPAPLIADGMVRVTLDPAGQETVALVHALPRSGGAGSTREEQWVIFDSAVSTFTFRFLVDQTARELVVTTTKSPPRLPWPQIDHPTSPSPPTYWWPVANGDLITAASFFSGVKNALSAANRPAFRYVWAAVTQSELTDTAPPLPAEYKTGHIAGRGWEEDLALTPSAPNKAREWVYAEWEKDPVGTPEYTPVTIHMAWRDYAQQIPPREVAVGTAFEATNRRTLKGWFEATRDRLAVSSESPGTYAVGDARLYTSTEFLKLNAKP